MTTTNSKPPMTEHYPKQRGAVLVLATAFFLIEAKPGEALTQFLAHHEQ